MDAASSQFLVFSLASALAFVGGYAARERRWLSEASSRHVHLVTLVGLWAPVSMLMFWRLALDGQLIWLMSLQALYMLGAALVMRSVARWLKWSFEESSLLTLGAALTNNGFSLGAYLCYVLMQPPLTALGYGMAMATAMQVFMVLLFYPWVLHVKRRLAPGEMQLRWSVLLRDSFINIRAAPLYAAGIGVSLQLLGLAPPEAFLHSVYFDILMVIGACAAYFGIGMRLRLGDLRARFSLHAGLAGTKFLLMPLAFLALAWWLRGLGYLAPLSGRVLVLESTMPVAINMVIVSNVFGLNARLASALWFGSTMIFLATVLPLLFLFA